MATFFVHENKDAGRGYVAALVNAGFEQVSQSARADFMLIDYERANAGVAEFLKTRPVFIYPHSPMAYFIWDGQFKPLPIQCNFVIGEAARRSMALYGYPNRVEIVGWNRCEIREFTPTTGSRLLFVPARQRGNGKYSSRDYDKTTPGAFQFVLDNRKSFEHVTVCYTGHFVDEADYTGTGIEFVLTTPGKSPSPALDMLRQIAKADLVISCETVACLAVASGKPTVVYNAKAVPTSGRVYASKYELYRKYYEFPLALEDMNIRDILGVCAAANPGVEEWKRLNIGCPFDAKKFVDIVKEYL